MILNSNILKQKNIMAKKKILVAYRQLKGELATWNNDFDFVFPNEKPTRKDFLHLIADCDAFFSAFNLQVDKEMIDAGKKLKIRTVVSPEKARIFT